MGTEQENYWNFGRRALTIGNTGSALVMMMLSCTCYTYNVPSWLPTLVSLVIAFHRGKNSEDYGVHAVLTFSAICAGNRLGHVGVVLWLLSADNTLSSGAPYMRQRGLPSVASWGILNNCLSTSVSFKVEPFFCIVKNDQFLFIFSWNFELDYWSDWECANTSIGNSSNPGSVRSRPPGWFISVKRTPPRSSAEIPRVAARNSHEAVVRENMYESPLNMRWSHTR